MNPLVVLIGAGIAATGLFLNNKKDLTNGKDARINSTTDHANSVPSETNDKNENSNQPDSTDSGGANNLDDLGESEKPE